MLRNVTLCAALLIGMFTLGNTNANAQAANYAFTAGPGTYSEISGGTVLATTTGIQNYASNRSIGFNFVFGGTTYSTVYVNGNGFISFGSNGLAGTGDVFRNLSSSSGVVAAWSNLLTGSSSGELSMNTLGSTGSRVAVFQWKGMARTGLAGIASADAMNFQIRLYEGTNRIEIVYGSMNMVSAMGAEIGLAFPAENPLAVVARAEGSPWDVPMVSRSAMESIARTGWAPSSGQTYTFKYRANEGVVNNAGVMALEMPNTKFAPATNQEIRVRIKNWGTNNLDSVTVNWTINGTVKTPVRYYPQPALAPNAEAVITLGYNTFAAGSFNTFAAWTSVPNGFPDQATGNDKFQTYLAPRVSGNLSISAGSGNPGVFKNFFEATRHLKVSGISGETRIRVFNADYNEQIIIPNIDNGGGSSKVTFYATANDEPKISWTPQAFPDGVYSNYEGGQSIVTLDGTRNIAIDNLNFYLPTGTQYGTFLYADMEFYTGSSPDNVQITNNLFQGPDNYSSMPLTANAIIIYAASNATNLAFNNNVLDNYSYGTYINAPSAASAQVNNNTYTDVATSGYYILGANSTVRGNSAFGSPSFTSFEGLAVEGNGPITVTANRIAAELTSGSAFGMLINPTSGNFTVTNNTVATTATVTNYGLIVNGFSNSSTVRVYHNTVNLTGTAANASSGAFRVNSGLATYPNFRVESVNNIFHNYGTGSNGGTAITVVDNTVTLSNPAFNPLGVSDFNNIYTSGTNIAYWGTNSVGILIPRATAPAHPLANWRTVSGRDNNSSSVLTTFVGGADLHLLAINPGLFGTTLLLATVPTDIDGETRVKPYMGADEVKPSIEIVTQPQSRYACLGESFNLIAIANVTPGATVTYQWQKDGIDLVGQTNAVLAFNNVGYGASGVYTALIKATDGSNTIQKLTEAASVIVVRNTSITVHPASTPVELGGTAILEVQAEAIGGPSDFVATYQWRKRYWNPNALQYQDSALVDNGRITGTTSNRLTITNVMALDTADEYIAVVTGYCGTAVSKAARLFIPLVVAANNTPGNCAGTDLSFEVSAFPSQLQGSAVRFQWYKDGSLLTDDARITGSMSKVLAIKGATTADAGTYTARATYGTPGTSIGSNDLEVTIGTAPTIATQPTGDTACAGDDVKISVAADGGQDVTYRWLRGTTAISGQTDDTLTLTAVQASDAGSYTVEVTNSCGTTTSSPVDVVVNTPASITTNPSNAPLTEGEKLTLTVAATGSGTLSYQWYQNGTAITGATSATYEKTGVVGSDSGSYTVIVTNLCGSDTSDAATVSIVVGVAGDVADAGYVLTSPVPNPAVGTFSFKYTLPSYQIVKISVTDLTGRVITQINEGAKETGVYTVNIDAANLNLQPGVYNYTISAGTFSATNQVVIVK